MTPILFLAIFFLGYANGANDNFKGVATLFGSRTTSYRRALGWATVTTCAGSLAALLLSQGLVKTFSGKGLVPDALIGEPSFLLAVGLGGVLSARKVAHTMSEGITRMSHGQGCSANLVTAFLVILASRCGLPVSTTHVSCGALFGIGIVNRKADPGVVRSILFSWAITLPVAAVLAALLYRLA